MQSWEKGQSLTELIVVITVATMIVGSLVFATIATLRNAQLAQNQAQASKLAQEWLEKIRTSRDRNGLVSIPPSTVVSWAGNGSANTDIWSYQINTGCGSGGSCYLKFPTAAACAAAQNTCYNLSWIATSPTFPSGAEDLTTFKRALILSDTNQTYDKEKQVTVIVTWTDFAGTHESRQITILRKI